MLPRFVRTAVLALTCFIACFWVFEILPLAVSSLFPVVLMPAFGILSTAGTSKAYGHWLIMLFVGAFIVVRGELSIPGPMALPCLVQQLNWRRGDGRAVAAGWGYRARESVHGSA